jgi:hypothetical protein
MHILPKRLLKFSNIHYFWPVAPKTMKFVLMWSLFQDAFGKKIQKSKNNVRSSNAAQNRFLPYRDSSAFRD